MPLHRLRDLASLRALFMENVAISATVLLFPLLIAAGLWTGHGAQGQGPEARGGLQAQVQPLPAASPEG
jgi:hypothetical protein